MINTPARNGQRPKVVPQAFPPSYIPREERKKRYKRKHPLLPYELQFRCSTCMDTRDMAYEAADFMKKHTKKGYAFAGRKAFVDHSSGEQVFFFLYRPIPER